MRLDIRHQPLNFDIYLSQVIDVPRTSIDEPAYNFKLELEALEKVDEIIQRTQSINPEGNTPIGLVQDNDIQDIIEQNTNITTTSTSERTEKCNIHHSELASRFTTQSNNTATLLTPSCPIEVPLTPIKCTVDSTTSGISSQQNDDRPTVNQINPRDFEEMGYNPFDHLELQTIDELRELDLVFQASYANQANTTTNKNSL